MNPVTISLTLAGLLLCAGCITVLAWLLTWRERAAAPPQRHLRLVAVVLPAATLLLGVVLWTLLHVMLLWAPGTGALAAR